MARYVENLEKEDEEEPTVLEVVSCRRVGMHYLITLSDDSTWKGRGSWWWNVESRLNPPAYVQHILCSEAKRSEKEEVYV